MGQFTANIQERIRNEEEALQRAFEGGDDYLIDVHRGELADLRRLAIENGVAVPENT